MSIQRLTEARAKLALVTEEVREICTYFEMTYPGRESTVQIDATVGSLESCDERLQDAIRYHPEGDCPR